MNHPTFPHLFSPIEIRGKEIRNRIFVPGHNTALSEGGRIGDAMLAYHEARMKGGVGMIMTEVHCVHETYRPAGRAWATTDDCLPGLRRLARLGRDHGVRVIGQVFHPGRGGGSLDRRYEDDRLGTLGGSRRDVQVRAGAALDSDGVLDYLNVVLGSTATYAGWQHIIPHMHYEAGYTGEKSASLKSVVSRMPVMIAGRINQPQVAEQILREGRADMIGIVRGHIADPEFIRKAFEGRTEDIRACIGCDQACIGHRLRGFAISCIQYPETGRELAYGTKLPAARPRKVIVVGGGPAGMKAAAVAAERGHEVTLLESSPPVRRPGPACPGVAGQGRIRWYRHQSEA